MSLDRAIELLSASEVNFTKYAKAIPSAQLQVDFNAGLYYLRKGLGELTGREKTPSEELEEMEAEFRDGDNINVTEGSKLNEDDESN